MERGAVFCLGGASFHGNAALQSILRMIHFEKERIKMGGRAGFGAVPRPFAAAEVLFARNSADRRRADVLPPCRHFAENKSNELFVARMHGKRERVVNAFHKRDGLFFALYMHDGKKRPENFIAENRRIPRETVYHHKRREVARKPKRRVFVHQHCPLFFCEAHVPQYLLKRLLVNERSHAVRRVFRRADTESCNMFHEAMRDFFVPHLPWTWVNDKEDINRRTPLPLESEF